MQPYNKQQVCLTETEKVKLIDSKGRKIKAELKRLSSRRRTNEFASYLLFNFIQKEQEPLILYNIAVTTDCKSKNPTSLYQGI